VTVETLLPQYYELVEPPQYAPILAVALAAADRHRERAEPAALYRHSQAGACRRAIYYDTTTEGPSDPMDVADVWVSTLGTVIHTAWQQALSDEFGDRVTFETPVVIHDEDNKPFSSGHLDALITTDDGPLCYELKTTNGYAFKRMTGRGVKGTPEGPRWSYIVQACLNAYAAGATEARIGLLSMESISRQVAKREDLVTLQRTMAEWRITEPTITELARAELARFTDVDIAVHNDTPSPRAVQVDDAEVVIEDPSTGTYYNAKGLARTTWHCTYCRHRTRCCEDVA